MTEGYICSSAVSTSKNYDDVKKKHISKLLADTWNKLDKDFFDRVRKYLNKESYNPIPYFPRPHQENATNEAYNHFIKNKESRGKLIFPCGAGKSLTGFWMMEKLDSMSTVIAVPSLSLIKQTLDVYLKEIVARGIKVNWLCICSDEGIGDNSEIRFKTDDIGVPCKTDPEYIKEWLVENKDTRNIIFTTYQSSRLIATISKELNHTFDLGILDEAHKTVGGSDKLFSHLLFEENISIRSRIFMTATERFYSGSKDDIVSMDDNDIYGDIFAQMSFKEAIDLELLTDYKIITIDIKKSEISEFIKDNGLVELNSVWKKETEARSLASMLALRKAMKQFPIKNAVSFHSSIAKAQRNKELHTHITSNYGYEPIDTYTVSGKDKTSVRNDIIQEFASSKKALITNARCLTEGVDVPNIDCIVFADPRKSKVDIVQALGRALRKKEGKDWGYVILPVIYDGETNEIDNDNFNEILSIVRGLAANDERIIEYFKDKSLGKGKERNGGAEVFTMISDTLSESDFAEQLNIRIWEKLSRFNWMPFEEAREFIRSLNLKSYEDYKVLHKNNKLPKNLPIDIRTTYKNMGFITMPDFLGYESLFQEWLPFKEARELIHKLKLKTQKDWYQYCQSGNKHLKIPSSPNQIYKDEGWISLGDWLGSGTISTRDIKYKSFEQAREFARELNLKTIKDWREYCKTEAKPSYIPNYPNQVYKEKGFISMPDFLGYKNLFQEWLPFEEAREFARKLNLKTRKDWREYCKTEAKPSYIPNYPNNVYKKKGWNGIGDWLGSKKVANQNREYLPFEEARAFVRSLGFKTEKDWLQFSKTKEMPNNIPIYAKQTYKEKGYLSMADWLGNDKPSYVDREFMTFIEAREFVHNLNLKNNFEWRLYSKSGKRPYSIPGTPERKYKNKGWKGYRDWLGTSEIASSKGGYRSFEDAKEYVQALKLKNQSEWQAYAKSPMRPKDIPSTPQRVYKNKGWNGLADWLGNK